MDEDLLTDDPADCSDSPVPYWTAGGVEIFAWYCPSCGTIFDSPTWFTFGPGCKTQPNPVT